MQKRHPARDGAVLLGGELAIPNKTRPIIQANAAMQSRLCALLWGFPWTGEAHRG